MENFVHSRLDQLFDGDNLGGPAVRLQRRVGWIYRSDMLHRGLTIGPNDGSEPAVALVRAEIVAGRFDSAILHLHSAEARCRLYEQAVTTIPEAQRAACVQAIFTGTKPLPSVSRSLRAVATARELRNAVPETLPLDVTVFRGVDEIDWSRGRYWLRHIQWTLSQRHAEQVASRRRRGLVAVGSVSRDDILAYFEAANGDVVLLNPDAVTDVKIVEIVARRAA